MVEGRDRHLPPVEVGHAGPETLLDAPSPATANGTEGAFEDSVLQVLQDRARVHVAVDGGHAGAGTEQLENAVRPRRDPSGIVG